MCGIMGYVGHKNAVPFLFSGLAKLKYRGYDSSGIAVYSEDGIKVAKKEGRLQVLEDHLKTLPEISGTLGIGHTRWATHGGPSDVNAHPHASQSGKIALLHNGIIENYMELKKLLLEKGYTFKSETDTEVVAQLMEYLYDGDIFSTVKKTVARLEGAFAFGIICADNPDTLIAVKKDSPLIVGIGENENYMASDIPALLPYTRKMYRLQENEIAIIKSDGVKLYDFRGNPLSMSLLTVSWDVATAEKDEHEHFMIKEIMEQPQVLKSTISPRLIGNEIKLDDINFSKEYLENLRKIYIVACGSASHVGYVGKYIIEKLTRKSVEVDLASEFRYRSPIVDENTLVIIISQSGETADSLAALREAKKRGAKVLSIVNVVGSSIANESDYVLYTWAGPEIAVATTKAYSTQLSLVYLLALDMSKKLETISSDKYGEYINCLKLLPEQVSSVLDQKEYIRTLAGKYYKSENVFFLGRTVDYAVCMEGSLKLKEISYIHSEAYAAGELKHGTIALIQDETLVVAVATQDELFDKIVSNIREVKARGAKILAISTEDKAEKISQVADSVIYVPKTCGDMMPSLAVIALQLFSYYVALLRDCDIDKPRNLAKSVTVE